MRHVIRFIVSAIVLAVVAFLIPGAADYPAGLVIPFADWISAFMNWFKVTFTWLTRGLVAIINVPLQITAIAPGTAIPDALPSAP